MGFRFIDEPVPGEKWHAQFASLWPGYQKWFLHGGVGARETYLSGLRALKKHMPELVPVYEGLCELAGGGDLPSRFLSFYSPPAYVSGCSQLAVETADGPLLIRNYDYAPHLCEGNFLHSAWLGRKVIASQDCLWGALDGMNEDGLAISLTFGGRQVVGKGFGAPLILRYVLETCASTSAAVDTISAIPCHMAYNFTVLDAKGVIRTVFVAPDEKPALRQQNYAVNHQDDVSWSEYLKFSRSFERERELQKIRSGVSRRSNAELFEAFRSQLLYSTAYHRGFGTMYTAAYLPRSGQAFFLWPDQVIEQSFGEFAEHQFDRSFTDRRPGEEGHPIFRPSELQTP